MGRGGGRRRLPLELWLVARSNGGLFFDDISKRQVGRENCSCEVERKRRRGSSASSPTSRSLIATTSTPPLAHYCPQDQVHSTQQNHIQRNPTLGLLSNRRKNANAAVWSSSSLFAAPSSLPSSTHSSRDPTMSLPHPDPPSTTPTLLTEAEEEKAPAVLLEAQEHVWPELSTAKTVGLVTTMTLAMMLNVRFPLFSCGERLGEEAAARRRARARGRRKLLVAWVLLLNGARGAWRANSCTDLNFDPPPADHASPNRQPLPRTNRQ